MMEGFYRVFKDGRLWGWECKRAEGKPVSIAPEKYWRHEDARRAAEAAKSTADYPIVD